MKIYFLADTHLGVKGDDSIVLHDWIDYYNKVFIPYCKEHVQPDDILVHLGDVTDNRSNIGLETINLTIKLFEDLSNIFSDIRLIVGNHDIFKKHSNEITSLNMLKYIPHVKIYYTPKIENILDKRVLFVPWIEEIDEQKKLLKSQHNVDYVFGHLEIGGAKTSSKGNMIHTNNAISSTDFKKAQVYAGHIHIRQDYKNIHYVGCPYHKDRGDYNNKKGITILDIETGETEFIENTFSPQFRKYLIYDILDKTVGELKKEWNNNYIDLVVNSNHYCDCNFDLLRTLFSGIYKTFNPIANKVEIITDNKVINLSDNKTTSELIDEYMKLNDVEPEIQERIKSKIETYKENL